MCFKLRTYCLEEAETECSRMVFRLHAFLADDQVRERLRTWREQDVADINADDLETLKTEANRLITNRIVTEIQDWETKTDCVKEAFENITRLIQTKYHVFDKELDQISSIFSENSTEGPLNVDG